MRGEHDHEAPNPKPHHPGRGGAPGRRGQGADSGPGAATLASIPAGGASPGPGESDSESEFRLGLRLLTRFCRNRFSRERGPRRAQAASGKTLRELARRTVGQSERNSGLGGSHSVEGDIDWRFKC